MCSTIWIVHKINVHLNSMNKHLLYCESTAYLTSPVMPNIFHNVFFAAFFPFSLFISLSLFLYLFRYLPKTNSLLLRGQIIFGWTLTFIYFFWCPPFGYLYFLFHWICNILHRLHPSSIRQVSNPQPLGLGYTVLTIRPGFSPWTLTFK